MDQTAPLQHGDVKLNWPLVTRRIEPSYRCNLCRRCAQTCPIGTDNGLVAHELRKLFSQEMGIAAKELHDSGSMLQLKVGSSTGMNDLVVKDNIEFIRKICTQFREMEPHGVDNYCCGGGSGSAIMNPNNRPPL